jgi:predicted ribosome quality control (RQC) complex YloA/Tae2 family protein
MGDTAYKTLIIEIMGKHSNVMLTDKSGKVLDALKHVPPSMSSVRTILPNAVYAPPPSRGKVNPLAMGVDLQNLPEGTLSQALFTRFNGISPVLAAEICACAKFHPDTLTVNLSTEESTRLAAAFSTIMQRVQGGNYAPQIYYDNTGKAADITPWPFLMYAHYRAEPYTSPSEMLDNFYVKRDAAYRLMQKTTDLRKLLATLTERCQKKAATHEKALADTHNRDTLRIKGELLTAYLHKVARGASLFMAENFYDENKPLEISLDPTLSPSENAQKYFRQYNKQKRANQALQEQISQNQADLAYLESVSNALQNSAGEEDIAEIRQELAEQGFAKRRVNTQGKNKKIKQRATQPLHYTSSDGFAIYAGKNNTQNDQLTLRTAHATDLWFHTKDIAGSHVIVITRGTIPPERTLHEAANIAAYHSRARTGSNVAVDYTTRKNVRKPAGAKPGYVIYDHHKTLYVNPQEPIECPLDTTRG